MPVLRLGAVFCFLAVALGAFGAHALRETLNAHQTHDTWNTAVLYHFLHGLAIVVLAFHQSNRLATILFAAGIIIFSGSLYLLALTGVRWLGAITPIGGLCFLAGWVTLFLTARR